MYCQENIYHYIISYLEFERLVVILQKTTRPRGLEHANDIHVLRNTYKEDLIADWKLAVAGEPVFKIDPLR
jgi:hypothetical protein